MLEQDFGRLEAYIPGDIQSLTEQLALVRGTLNVKLDWVTS